MYIPHSTFTKNVHPMTTKDFQNKSCERLNPFNISLQYFLE